METATVVKSACGALLTIFGLIAPLRLSAQPTCTVTDLGTLGGSESRAYAINVAGQIVGEAHLANNKGVHAFLYENGMMQDLGTLGGSSSTANAINDGGSVVGHSYLRSSGIHHAFLFRKGKMQDLGTLSGEYSRANAINEVGQIAGNADIEVHFNDAGDDLTGFESHACLFFDNRACKDLGTLPQQETSCATGINRTGQVVGYFDFRERGQPVTHAFLYEGKSLKDLGTLGGSSSVAFAINNAGQVVGYSDVRGEAASHAFLYANGQMKDLGTIGKFSSLPRAINQKGQIVGVCSSSNQKPFAFLYQDGHMRDLNTLLPAHSRWNLIDAQGINDRGWIVGTGLIEGLYHAYLLKPVPNS